MTLPDLDALTKLREPFPASAVNLLPKPTKKENPKGKCDICKGYHGLPAVHLDYVGHAEVTDRLLSCDLVWNWEPCAVDDHGLPLFSRDSQGRMIGLWIRLTVAGVTRLGYGSVEPGASDAEKQLIGDCLARGTLITTDRGVVPIETVQVGDLVPTRGGWRSVTDHWLSEPAAPVVAVALADGRVLVGTAHHRIPTADGVTPMGALRNGDTLFAWEDAVSPQPPKTLSGEGAHTVDTPAILPATDGPTTWPPPLRGPTCIATFTQPPAAPSLTVGMSITAMGTPPTTTRRTSPRSLRQLMRRSTARTNPRKPGRATSAAGPTWLLATGRVGAPPLARNEGGGGMDSPTSAHDPPPPSTVGLARSVDRSSPRVSSGADSVPVRVVAVADAGTAEVWNLSVDGVHEYVANGIFVNNSIRNASMRFGVALDLWAKGDLESQKIEQTHDNPSSVGPTPTQANGHAAPAAPAGDAHAALMAALPGLESVDARKFQQWLRENGLRMPPSSPEVAAQMLAFVESLTSATPAAMADDGAPFDTAAEREAKNAGSAPHVAQDAPDGAVAVDGTPDPAEGRTAPDPVGPWEPVDSQGWGPEPTGSAQAWHEWVKEIPKETAIEWLSRRELSTSGAPSNLRARMVTHAHMRSGAAVEVGS